MLKRALGTVAAAALLLLSSGVTHAAGGSGTVTLTIGSDTITVGGQVETIDAAPEILGNRTMVPLRFVAQALGDRVGWDAATGTATVDQGASVLTLKVGAGAANLASPSGHSAITLDQPAVLVPPGRTMVPIRFVAQAFGAQVAWNGSTRTVTIVPAGSTQAALTTGATWSTAPDAAGCGTMDTRVLRSWITAQGLTLTVHLQNATDLCGSAGATQHLSGAPRLQITPLGAAGPVVAHTTLPALPPTLAPGTALTATVQVGGGLAPGYYTAALGGGATLNGSPQSFAVPQALAGAPGNFLVSSGTIPAGQTQTTSSPTPVVGGLSMPLVDLTWNAGDAPTFDVHAPLVCGPGTDRVARLTDISATATGADFTTALPAMGSGDDPAKAENTFTFEAFPAEAASVALKARVQVLACQGSGVGAALGSATVDWTVALPGAGAK